MLMADEVLGLTGFVSDTQGKQQHHKNNRTTAINTRQTTRAELSQEQDAITKDDQETKRRK